MDGASSNIYASANSVVKFNGQNYGEWSEQIRFSLGVMSLDHAILTEDEPAAITEESSETDKSRYETWERSNRLSLNLMRMTMAESFKPSMPKTESAREFIEKIKECSQSELADKSIVGSLMSELTTRKFDWSQPIHDHVTHMSNLAARLSTLGMEDLKELKAMLVQEEGRLKKMGVQVVNLMGHGGASTSKGKTSKNDKRKDSSLPKGPEKKIQKERKCFFCRETGHFKKDCLKRKAWFESNLNEVPNNTWWLDSGATTHVSHIEQGFSTIQPIKGSEQYLFMGNRMKAQIKGVGTYRLILDT
ncbi:uncharacterized protein LOC121803930 [Salvia splendens]|uniref:uncharacterized protein LOC121803930 n=1 Tax=Salvia splendens TaxID=180675 RepID=UPI001C27E493|nr:uncharacterized protein LOC121803930 [Salvia splendens]